MKHEDLTNLLTEKQHRLLNDFQTANLMDSLWSPKQFWSFKRRAGASYNGGGGWCRPSRARTMGLWKDIIFCWDYPLNRQSDTPKTLPQQDEE